MSTTKDLFLFYLKQLEELGVREFYWKPPAAKPASALTSKPKPAARPVPPPPLSTEEGQHRPSGLVAFSATSREKIDLLEAIEAKVRVCKECGLHRGRNRTVFASGNPDAQLVLVGEAPGFDEDKQGLPFVGAAGQLLTRMLNVMQLRREDVFICNTIKCHPPQNRNPEPDESIACEPYLIEQLDIVKPRVICALGKFAAQALLKSSVSITRIRGQWHEYRGIPMMPTFHPSYLLRNTEARWTVLEDLKEIAVRLGIDVSRFPSR